MIVRRPTDDRPIWAVTQESDWFGARLINPITASRCRQQSGDDKCGPAETGQRATGNILCRTLSVTINDARLSMGWERGRYYTRSRKVNGRVVREYVGASQIGELAAQLDSVERDRRELERQAERVTRDELAAQDKPLDELDLLADGLARAALLVAGCRQHKRGEWRQRRVRGQEDY